MVTRSRAMSDDMMDGSIKPVSAFVRGARWVYFACVCVLVVGVVAQVFLAGASLLVGATYLGTHIMVGHMLGLITYVIPIVGLFGRLPRRYHVFNVLVFGLYALQYIFVEAVPLDSGMVVLRALHAVNALVIFWFGVFLAGRVRELAQQ
jgi:hypothetical protein